jgi:ABC-type multidrug transport system ATPase subunit
MSATAAPPVLQVQGLCFAYPGAPALFKGWSFALTSGVHALDGDMGSGKTTLLRLLAMDLQGAGDLVLQGRRAADDLAAYRQRVCAVDARDASFEALTAEGLMVVVRARHTTLDVDAWRRHLVGFGLEAHQAKPMVALSTGSRQKAALAATLSAGCALTLLDEPTTGLDLPSMAYLAQVLGSVTDRAVLMVCSRGLEALPLAGRLTLPPAG